MMFFKALTQKLKRVKGAINKSFRYILFAEKRKKFTNHSISVFAINCVGCCMLHDLNVRFNSPFVNLYMSAEDFLKFLKNPQKYAEAEFKEVESEFDYPVGMLDDLTVHFVHYKTYDDAVKTFKKRFERVNYDNLYVIFSEIKGCTYEDLKTFDAMPYKNKVVFTHLPYEDIKSSFYVPGYEDEDCIGNILVWDKTLGRRKYDCFDFFHWLNK